MHVIDMPPAASGHAAPLTHVALRDDARLLASCSYDGTVVVWDVSDPARPTRTATLKHRRLVNASAWNPAAPQLLATASADKTVSVWRLPEQGSASLVNVLARHTDDINSVAWMPDGDRLICVSEDGRATMWDAIGGRFLGEVGSHEAHCMMVSVSPEGLVATVGEDGLVAVADPDLGADPFLRRYESSIEGCAWSGDGEVLAVTRDDGAVDLLTKKLDLLRTVEVSTSAARCVSWSQDDEQFVVGAYDGALHFFAVDGERLHRVDDARIWPRSVSAAGGLVAAGSFWGSPHLLDFASAAEIAGPVEPTHGPNAMAVDGNELYIGCDSGTVVVVPAGDAPRPRARLIGLTEGPILSLAVRDGVVYAGTYAGHVVRYDGAVLVSEQLGAPLPSLCFDGETLVAGTYNGELFSLDRVTLAVAERSQAHGGSVKSLTALPGPGFLSAATDRTVAAGSFTGRVTLWEHGNLVNAVAALDEEVAASASRDHTVKVGRLARTPAGEVQVQALQTLIGPDESVKCVAVLGTAESPFVLAGSYDFGLYVWPVRWEDGASVLTEGHLLDVFGQGLSCMAQLDASTVAVAGWDGRISIVACSADGGLPRVRASWNVQDLVRGARGTEGRNA
ncbi:WD40 repeat domain-containing protein [Streptomyces sp. MJP52]|uniref:WD40 repeat domain-containing protein n=1 Tax=Streptomyces sp. MJP52 TaxID=2940555 RepID=UPI002473F43B|nr:WD40 repeat domain-containing protein [Streptomyces sp. MJP52]MDH6228078.1 WD40 repeat protein [Streptomyces sp. MJP52]